MKTIKEWLETLEEPYRSEALENVYFYDVDTESLPDALSGCFTWCDTTQGYDYWKELYFKIKQNEN